MSNATGREIRGGLVRIAIFLLVIPLLPMWISGDWAWWQGWANALVFLISFIFSRLVMARLHPDLLVERLRFMAQPGTKSWDRIIAPLLGIGSLATMVTAGLDRRYAWTPEFGAVWHWAGLLTLVVGYGFSSWAPIANRFFSGTVRIQTERGHHVVTDGPYRFMRHPGYAGGLLGYLATPLLLNSAWCFVPAGLLLLVMIVRTSLEDRTLQAELPGYKEYAQKTRYRLLPGIW